MRISLTIIVLLAAVYGILFLWPASPPLAPAPYFASASFDVIAHRGGKGKSPENTLLAFQRAQQMGATVLELDVHLSADDELVVIHDLTVDRTTNGQGAVADFSLTDLKALDAGYRKAVDGEYPYRGKGIQIPTLNEVVSSMSTMRYVIEIKPDNESVAIKLCDFIKANGLNNRVIVGSFHSSAIDRFRSECPSELTSSPTSEVAIFYLLHKLGLSHWYAGSGETLQIPMMHFGLEVATRELIEDAQSRGLKVHVWTINDIETMNQLRSWGVDGIITDVPELLLDLLEGESRGEKALSN